LAKQTTKQHLAFLRVRVPLAEVPRTIESLASSVLGCPTNTSDFQDHATPVSLVLERSERPSKDSDVPSPRWRNIVIQQKARLVGDEGKRQKLTAQGQPHSATPSGPRSREIRRGTFALPFNGPSPSPTLSTTRPLGSTAPCANLQAPSLLTTLGSWAATATANVRALGSSAAHHH
jgi:hypothetical protein